VHAGAEEDAWVQRAGSPCSCASFTCGLAGLETQARLCRAGKPRIIASYTAWPASEPSYSLQVPAGGLVGQLTKAL
jgi:hypothetical protein